MSTYWEQRLACRMGGVTFSAIRELFKAVQQPGMISHDLLDHLLLDLDGLDNGLFDHYLRLNELWRRCGAGRK